MIKIELGFGLAGFLVVGIDWRGILLDYVPIGVDVITVSVSLDWNRVI